MPGSFAMLSVNSQPIHAVASVHVKALPPTYTHPSNHQHVNLYWDDDDDDTDNVEDEDDIDVVVNDKRMVKNVNVVERYTDA